MGFLKLENATLMWSNKAKNSSPWLPMNRVKWLYACVMYCHLDFFFFLLDWLVFGWDFTVQTITMETVRFHTLYAALYLLPIY